MFYQVQVCAITTLLSTIQFVAMNSVLLYSDKWQEGLIFGKQSQKWFMVGAQRGEKKKKKTIQILMNFFGYKHKCCFFSMWT